ncbi:MAG: hypothetical protein Q8M44_07085 [bacterium]|nr:hypothetical protein [bacterium]
MFVKYCHTVFTILAFFFGLFIFFTESNTHLFQFTKNTLPLTISKSSAIFVVFGIHVTFNVSFIVNGTATGFVTVDGVISGVVILYHAASTQLCIHKANIDAHTNLEIFSIFVFDCDLLFIDKSFSLFILSIVFIVLIF